MPSIFVFNPFTEGYLGRGKGFTPVKSQALLASDLANLPQFLCRQDDIVLVPKLPSDDFLSGLNRAGFTPPEFVELKDQSPEAISNLCRRKIDRLRPWAWGPDSVALFAPLLAGVTGEERAASLRFNEGIAPLYSKAWSAALLKGLLQRRSPIGEHRFAPHTSPEASGAGPSRDAAIPATEPLRPTGVWADEPWLCSEREVGVTVDTVEGALAALDAIRQCGHHRIVIKEALGLAGRNSIRLWELELLETQRRWLANAVHNGRQLVVEPWLEREVDFSVQLEMGTDGLKLCGFTGLTTDRKGQFQANWAAPDHTWRIPAIVTGRFSETGDVTVRLQCLYDDIFSLLETELRHAGYLGPVGIDAFVYRTPDGQCRLKPIVEINPRYTMGRLTVELMNHTCPGSYGLFRLVNRAMTRAEGYADFVAYARSLTERFPLLLEGGPFPKIREGALCLNDPVQAQVGLAVFRVGRTLDASIVPERAGD